MEERKRKKILQDHKKIGSKLLPPFQYTMQNLTEVSWIEKIIPEIIWTAILNDLYGYAKGAELTAELTKAAASAIEDTKKNWCFSISSFIAIEDKGKENIINILEKLNIRQKIGSAFAGLQRLYPSAPFEFLIEGISSNNSSADELSRIKSIINNLYDRTTIPATFAQANILYGAFLIDKLKVFEGLILAEFPEIQDYPNTEKSKLIAANVRANITCFFGFDDQSKKTNFWPKYFWNRGLELEPCKLY